MVTMRRHPSRFKSRWRPSFRWVRVALDFLGDEAHLEFLLNWSLGALAFAAAAIFGPWSILAYNDASKANAESSVWQKSVSTAMASLGNALGLGFNDVVARQAAMGKLALVEFCMSLTSVSSHLPISPPASILRVAASKTPTDSSMEYI